MPEWRINDFSGGMIDKVEDHLLPENASKDCQNFIATKIGSLRKCLGQARLNSSTLGGPIQGLHAYYGGETRRLIVVANGIPYYWNTATSAFVAITMSADYPTNLDTSAPVQFANCVNYVVGANGVQPPFKWTGAADSAITKLANAPATGRYPTYHQEKLFLVPASEPSCLKWSNSFAPETWEAVNQWQVKEGDGDVITALVPFIGELVIFKRYSIHSLRGTSLDDFRIEEVVTDVGAVGPRAVVEDGACLYFVADSGIHLFNGLKVVNLTRNSIPNLWATINLQYIDKAVAGKWNGYLWFALPEGPTATYNNLVLLYEPVSGGAGRWWPRRGINASCFLEYNTGSALKFYSGGAADGYVREQWIGATDDGAAISAYWIGKAVDMGVADRSKKFGRAFLIDNPGAQDVDLDVSLDYSGTYSALTSVASESLVRSFVFPSTANTGRYMQPKLKHSALTGCEVRGLMVQYKVARRPG